MALLHPCRPYLSPIFGTAAPPGDNRQRVLRPILPNEASLRFHPSTQATLVATSVAIPVLLVGWKLFGLPVGITASLVVGFPIVTVVSKRIVRRR